MSETFKATKYKKTDTSEKTEVFKATKYKRIDTSNPETLKNNIIKNHLNGIVNETLSNPQAAANNILKQNTTNYANGIVNKVQNGELVEPEEIENAAKFFESQQTTGWAAFKNPPPLQQNGKEIASALREIKKISEDIKNSKEDKKRAEKSLENAEDINVVKKTLNFMGGLPTESFDKQSSKKWLKEANEKYYGSLERYLNGSKIVPKGELKEKINSNGGTLKYILEREKNEAVKIAQIVTDGEYNSGFGLLKTPKSTAFKYIKDYEKNVLVYLYNTEGKGKAKDYIEYLFPILNERMTVDTVDSAKKFADKNPVTASLISHISNLGRGSGVGDSVYAFLSGSDIDVNSSGNQLGIMTDAIRNAVATNIVAETKNIPILKEINKATSYIGIDNIPAFVYETATSAVDSAINFSIGKGFAGVTTSGASEINKLTSAITSTLMGSQVTQSAIIQAKQSGLSDEDALTLGLIRGSIETITEKYSIDNILDNPNSMLGKVVKNPYKRAFISEGSEEDASNWLNRIVDGFYYGDNSQLKQSYNKYIKDGKSQTEALALVAYDIFKEDTSSFIAGGISGMGIGTANNILSGLSGTNISKIGKVVAMNEMEGEIINVALSLDSTTEANKLAVEISNNGNITVEDIGKLAVYTLEELNNQKRIAIKDAVYNKVMAIGGDYIEAGAIADYYARLLTSARITAREKKAISNNVYVDKIWEDNSWYETVHIGLVEVSSKQNRIYNATSLSPHSVVDSEYKKEASQTTDALSPSATPNSETANASSDINISQDNTNVNNIISRGTEDYSENSGLQSTANEQADIDGQIETPAPTIERALRGKERHRVDKSEQDLITKVADTLGVKVQFEHITREKLEAITKEPFEGELPNGYIDGEGVIHIGFAAKDPLRFVFKHELTHFGEGTENYKKFVKAIRKSKAYEQWLRRETVLEKGSVEVLEIAYENRISQKYSKDTNLEAEMIADFVGDILFNEDASGLENLLNSLDYKERNAVIQFLLDFVNYLKKKLAKGDKKLAIELSQLEDKFNRMLSEALGTEKTTDKNGSGIKYTINSVNISEADIKKNIEDIKEMKAVANLSGNEFSKGEKNLVSQVEDYFATFNYSVENSILGDVDITARGAKDSIAHGIGRNKAIAFAAVPSVIENGKIIDYQSNWKNRGYDTVVLAAPVTISNQPYYEGVIVLRDSKTQRFYVHEVITEKRTDMSFKTGADNKVGKSGDISSPSIISLLDKIRIVKENLTTEEVDNNNSMQEGKKNSSNLKFSFARADDINLVNEAEQMERDLKAENKSEEEIRAQIWKETGLIRDTGDVWVYEIDDSNIEFRPFGDAVNELTEEQKEFYKLADMGRRSAEKDKRFKELRDKYGSSYFRKGKLKDFLIHDELFEKYPRLRETNFEFNVISTPAHYNPETDTIVFNAKRLLTTRGLSKNEKIFDDIARQIDFENYIIHEIQHALQHYEDRENGSNVEFWNARLRRGERLPVNPETSEEFTPFEAYMATKGEYEARESSNRKILNESERREEVPDLGWGKTISAKEPALTSNSEDSMAEEERSANRQEQAPALQQKAIDSYSEEQYNNFGWASYNDVISTAERETLLSRYADYKHNKDKYPTTRFGEVVIHSTESPDVIMYVKGDIGNPQITKVVRIVAETVEEATIIKEGVLANEYDKVSFPYEAIEDAFGTEVLDISKKRDFASFQEYISRTEGRNSQESDTDSGAGENRGSGTEQNKKNDRAGLNKLAFSMPKYDGQSDNPTTASGPPPFRQGRLSVPTNEEYISAVESGDTETARKMVDEAAKANGYTERLYHQTGAEFTEFNTENQKAGKFDWELPTGTFLKPTSEDIGLKGKKQMELYAKFQNPITLKDRKDAQRFWKENIEGYSDAANKVGKIDSEYRAKVDEAEAQVQDYIREWKSNNPDAKRSDVYSDSEFQKLYDKQQDIMDEWEKANEKASAEAKGLIDDYIRESGYDGVIIERDDDGKNRYTKSYIAFDSAQLKDASAVTYDDNGEIIALSERFDGSKKDIRFSMPGRPAKGQQKNVASKRKIVYNEYATNVMQWANSASTEVNDVKIFSDRSKSFVLNMATEDGYIELARGNYEEVRLEYERLHQGENTSLYEDIKKIRSDQRGNLWDIQPDEIGEYAIRNPRPIGSEEFRSDSSRDSEHLRSSNKGEYVDSKADLKNKPAFSMPRRNQALFERYDKGELSKEEYIAEMDLLWDEHLKEMDDQEIKRKIESARYANKLNKRIREQNAQLAKRRSEVRQEETERREERATKQKNIEYIRKIISSLDKKLRTNSDKKHIQEKVKPIVEYLVKVFVKNDTSPFDEKDIGMIRLFYYDMLKKSDPDIEEIGGLDPQISTDLERLEETMVGKTLRDLNKYETDLIRNIVDNLNNVVNWEEKMVLAGKEHETEQVGRKALKEISSQKAKRTNKVIDGIDGLKYSNMTPIYFFDRMGETFKTLFGDILKAQDKSVVLWNNSKTYISNIKKKYNYSEWEKDRLNFTTKNGDEIEITREQGMLLYSTAKREYGNKIQDSQHLFKGGVVVEPNSKSLKEIIEKYKSASKEEKNKLYNAFTEEVNERAVRIMPEDVLKVFDWLTEEQKNYADAMVDYLSNDMAALGNEVSMQLYGIRKYNDNYYIPYNSAQNYLYSQPGVPSETRLAHQSFTKETVPKANTPLILSDFSTVCADHINRMCMYNAMTIPLENMNKIFNYKVIATDEKNQQNMKAEIARAYGQDAVNYIKQFLEDANGNLRVSSEDRLVNKWISKFKKGAVFASASVVFQQFSAVMRAMTYIKPKYFRSTTLKFRERDYQECCKYAPVAVLKQMGRFDTGMGMATTNWLLQENPKGIKEKTKAFLSFKDSTYRDDVLSFAAAKADEITWAHIWAAVKAEIKDNTDLKVGSEEFLKACGERFTHVINYTQVYDSTLSRSQIMRNKGSGAQMLTAFMAEPTVSLNLLMDAAHKAKTDGKAGRKFAARAVGAFVGNVVLNALLKSLVTAARDDEEEKTYLEKYTENFMENMLSDLNPLSMIPFVKDVISIFEGYSVERADMNLFSDLAQSLDDLDSKNKSVYEKIESLSGSLAAFLGLPVKNVLRDVRAAYNLCNDLFVTDKVDRAVNKEVKGYIDELEGNKTYNTLPEEDKEKLQKNISDKVRETKSQKSNSKKWDDMENLYRLMRENNKDYKEERQRLIEEGKYTAEEISDGIEIARVSYMKTIGINIHEYLLWKIATSKKYADTDKSGGVSKKEKEAATGKMDIDSKAKDYFKEEYK